MPGKGTAKEDKEGPPCSRQQISAERNKRLLAWMADELNLEASERPSFYTEMSKLITNVTDRELAEILYRRLAPQRLLHDIEDARKLIRHFHDIATSWLSKDA
jgi:hypothetical protein